MPTKVRLVKAMVFPVVMCECESGTIKKGEHQRIDAFELWCWRRLLRVPWTARRSSQSIPKKISPECSLEGLKLKLKLQYFGHLMRRADSLEKTVMLGGFGGRRRRGWQKMRWLDGTTTQWTRVYVDSGSWWWTGRPGGLRFMGSQRVGHDWATELNWTELVYIYLSFYLPVYVSLFHIHLFIFAFLFFFSLSLCFTLFSTPSFSLFPPFSSFSLCYFLLLFPPLSFFSRLNHWAPFAILPSWHSAHAWFSRLSLS